MILFSKHPPARVSSITRLRVNVDGGGVRSVIFLYGCPLNCAWCCNPETRRKKQYHCVDAKTLYGHIAQDLPYFMDGRGGVTFSGGEPLLHADFLEGFIGQYCSRFSVNIETSLYASRKQIRRLIPLIDEWYIDFKVFDPGLHRDFTGVSNRRILSNLEFLASQIDKDRIVITYPLIPGYNTSGENLSDMLHHLQSLGIHRIQLHPYRKFQEEKHRALGLEPIVIPELTAEQRRGIENRIAAEGFQLVQRPAVQGRDKCRYLKQIRMALREEHRIPVEIADCSFQGQCIGTCPQCEHELSVIREYLEVQP